MCQNIENERPKMCLKANLKTKNRKNLAFRGGVFARPTQAGTDGNGLKKKPLETFSMMENDCICY